MAWIVNEWTQTTHNWISLNFADFTFDVHEASSPFSTIVDDRMRRNGEHMKINTLKPFAVIEWHFVTMRNIDITTNSFVKQIHAHTHSHKSMRARQIVVSVHRRKERRKKKQQKLHTRAKSQSNVTKSSNEICEIWKSSRSWNRVEYLGTYLLTRIGIFQFVNTIKWHSINASEANQQMRQSNMSWCLLLLLLSCALCGCRSRRSPCLCVYAWEVMSAAIQLSVVQPNITIFTFYFRIHNLLSIHLKFKSKDDVRRSFSTKLIETEALSSFAVFEMMQRLHCIQPERRQMVLIV